MAGSGKLQQNCIPEYSSSQSVTIIIYEPKLWLHSHGHCTRAG